MKTIWHPVLLSSLIFIAAMQSCNTKTNQQNNREQPPNVVLIITDDHGYGDLGFHGNPVIQTPNLDSLMRSSTRFNNFYVSPVCAPTRSSLMTGKFSIRTGVYDTYNGGAIMAAEETTMAEVFKQNGYQTGMFGKWHLGDNHPYRPIEQGFDHSLNHKTGGIGQVGDVYNYRAGDSAYFDPVLWKNGDTIQTQGYCSDVFTNGAIDFVRNTGDKPFFLYLSYNAPHTPLQLPEKYLAMYDTMTMQNFAMQQHGHPLENMSKKDLEDAKRVYGMVSNIDDNFKRLQLALNQSGKADNTVIIFMTDNGPQQRRYTGGLRGRKSSVYEGGIRVPFCINYPKIFPTDHEITNAAAHIDILPTLADICGIELPNKVDIDGKSLLPLLEGKTESFDNRNLYFYWQRGYPEPYRNIAVRHGDFKLVGHTAYDSQIEEFELFNISEDPYELHNLIEEAKDTALYLKTSFDQWHAKTIINDNLVNEHYIKVDMDKESPVILNRNDAKGPIGIWAQNKTYGYWDVDFVNTGNYDFTFHFYDTLKRTGKLVMKLSPYQTTIINDDTTTRVLKMEGVNVKAGKYSLRPHYDRGWNDFILPFYVEVEASVE